MLCVAHAPPHLTNCFRSASVTSTFCASSRGPEADEQTLISSPHPRATLAATILGSSLAFIDGSVVNVALPVLGRDLHASASSLPWAINAYLLPVGALTLLGGGLGDHFGRRRLFLVGLSIFLLGSTTCGAAISLPGLLAGRGLQGVGAALLMPNSLAILGSEFSGEARGRAIGTWAAVGALAGALGPVLGGWLVDTAGWRVIFFINVPLGVGAGYLGWKYVRERTESRNPAPLDASGAALATAALGLLTWSLTEASNTAGTATMPWIAAIAGTVLLGAFLWLEKRLAERALMPFGMFAAPALVGLTLLTFFLYGSLGGLLVLLPFFLIKIEHWSAVTAGAALLPLPVLIAVGSRLMGRVAGRHGGRLPLSVGSGLVAVGLSLYSRVGAATVNYWSDVLPPTLLVALGMGACVAPLTTSVMASVDARHVGIASGFNSAVARVAGLIATALLGFVFARQDSTESFVVGFRTAALIGAGSAAVAAACALLLLRSEPAPPA
jgi:EmrB/QacA subfamily drug resistance transporter